MAERVVDRFEAVQVDAKHRAVGLRIIDRNVDVLLEQSTIRQIGQRIVRCQMARTCFGFASIGDIFQRLYKAASGQRAMRHLQNLPALKHQIHRSLGRRSGERSKGFDAGVATFESTQLF